MLKTSAFARTVKCGKLRDLNANKEGKNPSYVINFTIATDRNYLRTVVDENGETKKVKDSDFMNCCAYGNLAKIIDKNFNIYDEEDKFISRRIVVHGNIEKYKTESKVTIEKVLQIEIDGKPRNIKCSFEQPIRYENTRLSVSDIEFADATPENIKNKKSDAIVVTDAVLLDESEEINADQLVNANVVKETDETNKEITSEKGIEENSEDITDKIQKMLEEGNFEEATKLNEEMNSNYKFEEQEEQEESELVDDLSTNGDTELE
ncbi:single-strand binding family protein (plasmid) [Clostridium baratii str. Sullivan]|uniref:Single-strand binding family protein n=1 Tax=Clostridium baratii str. Sullivan TaxID=1415775 RepID=A0A0A7G021_9CLOT|nr:single-stranded DNA-binding protein [Clostridium baratii]AIY85224.1 single-strand binding family protein [Clostridium baratii str. Sullivan]